ncbi:hypothetical protein C3F09_10740 [candidate division GN15 bacterium]|uniref:FlgD/Vpr Ig-like domain-containing protein n=1 Tax=candidate division GN15 bacterium TaxID=2072418 RepID=A0A855X2Z7_9BACT|nr:MAG: hypothetical protein C3F09_10740 [candidate division GN15 bacterium]
MALARILNRVIDKSVWRRSFLFSLGPDERVPLYNTNASYLIPLIVFLSTFIASRCLAFEPLFDGCINYPVGYQPASVCIADFDRDGHEDIATANANSHNVSVLKNDGDGYFFSQSRIPAGNNPRFIVADDFDTNGTSDLAVADMGTDSAVGAVLILINTGDGTFTVGESLLAGQHPFSICTGDFNRDGRPDLGVLADERVAVLLSTGDASFAPAVFYDAGSHPSSICAADLDKDGDLDLVVANYGDIYDRGTISIFKNQGAGSFLVEPAVNIGVCPSSIAASDLDGDGIVDLTTASFFPGTVSVIRNRGDGILETPVQYSFGTACISIAARDLDGDGRIDLAAAGGHVAIFRNIGGGTFANADNIPVGMSPWSVATGNLDSDDRPDIAVVTYTSDCVAVLRNDGTGQYSVTNRISVSEHPNALIAMDFDEDSRLDLAVAAGDHVSLLKNDRSDNFVVQGDIVLGTTLYALAAAELFGNGRPDLAVVGDAPDTTKGMLLLLQNMGGMTFDTSARVEIGNNPSSVCAGDFNEDGKIDLAITSYGCHDDSTAGYLSILMANGPGTFDSARTWREGEFPQDIIAADLNRDGHLDLAIASTYSNSVSVLFGDGNGSFSAGPRRAVGGIPWEICAVDLDGDTLLDLVTANLVTNTVAVLKNQGMGNFASAVTDTLAYYPTSISTGDFDGNGSPDLVAAIPDIYAAAVLLNTGDGSLTSPVYYGCEDSPYKTCVGDFDSDGRSDLAISGSGFRSVSVMRNLLTWQVDTPLDEHVSLPRAFDLLQNYPNPFNPSTEILFTLPVREHATLAVYNLLGEQVRVLADETLSAGEHRVTWDGRDARGNQVASGVYLYRLTAGTSSQSKKMLLLK